MSFKRIEEERPYPTVANIKANEWATLAPVQVPISSLVTIKRTLDLEKFLSEDSTFYGDLFIHVVKYKDELYLEDGLHRTLRTILQQKKAIYARVLNLDDDGNPILVNMN